MRPEEAIGRLVASRRPLLLALDVDGTLAPIVRDPERARVPDETRAILRALVARPDVRVALVTGRAAGSLRRVLPLRGAWRALEHGRSVVAPGASARTAGPTRSQRARLEVFAAWARRCAAPRGGRLERKPFSLAVHVRQLASRDARAASLLLIAAGRAARRAGLHPRKGRWVVEAEVEPGDKGHALEAIRRATRSGGLLYAGDDLTDAPAILEAVRLGGVGVHVRSRERMRAPRGASLAVDGPPGVRRLLADLLTALAS